MTGEKTNQKQIKENPEGETKEGGRDAHIQKHAQTHTSWLKCPLIGNYWLESSWLETESRKQVLLHVFFLYHLTFFPSSLQAQ